MSELALIPGLLLPWLAGVAILAKPCGRPVHAGWAWLLAGYGFFVGYALLAALVWAELAMQVETVALPTAVLLAVAAAGFAWYGFAHRRLVPVSSAVSAQAVFTGGWGKVLATLLGAWLLAHLLFALLEIVATPLFPWDAMTVWVYRAKAWFLSGGLFEFLTLEEWLRTGTEVAYTVPAVDYPLLPSIVPYWAALSLGQWHEALINTPAWLCGLAIVLGFYGQCRSLGLAQLPAIAFSYLLASTPLFGVHQSLGGYADIWLAGFAGLGFIALLRGLPERRVGQIVLGFTLLLMGLMAKEEGVIWLFAGLLLFISASLPGRALLGGTLAVGLIAVVMAVTNWTWFELPVIGVVGFRDGYLHVPLAGAQQIEVHAVGAAYLRNAFVFGSWSLSWLLLAVVLIASLLMPGGREKRTVLAFLLIFMASQAAIFTFTEAGVWARDNTAINRLPLQVYPALLFAAVMAFRRCRQTAAAAGGAGRFARVGLAVFILAGAVTLSGAIAWLQLEQHDSPQASIRLTPQDLQAVVGSFRTTESGLVADGYDNGIVLLSSGPVEFDADTFYLLRIELDLDPGLMWPDEAPAFFWRTDVEPGTVSRVTLDGAALIDLSVAEGWRGRITEVGLLFPGHGGRPATLESLALEGKSLAADIELLPRKWMEFEPWSQRSANVVYGGAPDQPVPLNLLVALWVLFALILLLLMRARLRGQLCAPMAMAFLLAWMLLDVRWTVNRARQAGLSWTALTTATVDERIGGTVFGKYHSWTRRARDEWIGAEPARVLLVRDPAEFPFYAWYARYQLLPHAVAIRPGLQRRDELSAAEYVLFLGPFPDGEAPGRSVNERLQGLPIAPGLIPSLRLEQDSEQGALFSIISNGQAGGRER